MRTSIGASSAKDTMEFLVALDPAFETELEEESSDDLTHHRVMMLFADYFGANHRSFSEKQLRRLGEWLSSAVAAGGDIENAVSTCFLEHARQLKVNRTLAPYLSRLAKQKTHA
jgi:hypothetical protein